MTAGIGIFDSAAQKLGSRRCRALFYALLYAFVGKSLLSRINWAGDNGVSAAAASGTLPDVPTLICFALAALCLIMLMLEYTRCLRIVLPCGAGVCALIYALFELLGKDGRIVFISAFLALFALGKSFREIARAYLYCALVTLAAAFILLKAGYAAEFFKPENEFPGHSFGLIHPNTWGYIAFIALTALWYLHFQKAPVVTFALFWGAGAFILFVISCRTVAMMCAAFPFGALAAFFAGRKPRHIKALRYLFCALPLLCFALSLILSLNAGTVERAFYPTPFKTMAMRFVNGGTALRVLGFTVLGKDLGSEYIIPIILGGAQSELIVDNAYILFSISRGIVWLALCLLWQVFANVRAFKARDYALILLLAFMSLFALMERPGLEVWCSMALLYPAASFAPADNTEEGRI